MSSIKTLFLFAIFFPIMGSVITNNNQTENKSLSPITLNPGMKYHTGPVLSPAMSVHIIWYCQWPRSQKHIIRDFIKSLSASNHTSPSVSDWWKLVQIYNDVSGANVTSRISLGHEKNDRLMSHGRSLTRLDIQSVIKTAITAKTNPLPADPMGGLYLVLTAKDVVVDNFCVVCGFHFFTFPLLAGYTLPFAWIGNSQTLCPGICAYPFAVPDNMRGNVKPLKSPNGNIGVDGMIIVIAHELAEVSTNPLINAWYAGDDPTFPNEISDVCLGIYSRDSGGGYLGMVPRDQNGAVYNVNGARRRFLLPWVWSYLAEACVGPNM